MSSRTIAGGLSRTLTVDAGKRFDGLVVAATWWFGIGLFSDGWAHIEHLPDSFWTVAAFDLSTKPGPVSTGRPPPTVLALVL